MKPVAMVLFMLCNIVSVECIHMCCVVMYGMLFVMYECMMLTSFPVWYDVGMYSYVK